MANGYHSAAGSRRNSISKLPWPEPSPVRELPPPIPKQKVNNYDWKYILNEIDKVKEKEFEHFFLESF